jgi:hypothetical protein
VDKLVNPCKGCEYIGYSTHSNECHLCEGEYSNIEYRACLAERKAIVEWLETNYKYTDFMSVWLKIPEGVWQELKDSVKDD